MNFQSFLDQYGDKGKITSTSIKDAEKAGISADKLMDSIASGSGS